MNEDSHTAFKIIPDRGNLTGINRIDRINAQIMDMFLSCSSCASL
jgi:hypothetical protein